MIGYMFAKDTLPPFTALDVRLVCLTPGCESEYHAPSGWTEQYPHDLSSMVRETAGTREGWTVDEYGIDRCPRHGTGKAPYSAYPQGHPLAREDAAPPPAAVTHPDGIVIPLPAAEDTVAAAKVVAVFESAQRAEEARKARAEAGAITLSRHTGKHRGKPKRSDDPPEPRTPQRKQPAKQDRRKERVSLLARLGLISREPLDLPDNAPSTDDPAEWMKPLSQGDTRASWQMRSSWTRRGWLGKRRAKTTGENTDATGVAA